LNISHSNTESYPKQDKNGFLKQGYQFALDKLNERSRSILDNGLQRIAKGALKANDEKAFGLINKYALSEAKFDEKDADTMYDKYLNYAGFEPQAADASDVRQTEEDKGLRQPVATKEEAEVAEKPSAKSSVQPAREMKKKSEAAKPDKSMDSTARLPDSVGQTSFHGIWERLFTYGHLSIKLEGGQIDIVRVENGCASGFVRQGKAHGKITDIHVSSLYLGSEGDILYDLVTRQHELRRANVHPSALGKHGTSWHEKVARGTQNTLKIGIAEQISQIQIPFKLERTVLKHVKLAL
jgi:hypothetical protein